MGPTSNPSIGFVGRQILHCHDACIVPLARQRIGERKVLAGLCRRIRRSRCEFENSDGLIRIAGEGYSQAEIGSGQLVSIIGECRFGSIPAALRNLRKRKIERGTLTLGIQRQCVREGLFGRLETACTKISLTQQHPIARVARLQ